MAAVADCRKIFNNNVANITSNYDKGVIDITTAKILYSRELTTLQKCSGGNMGTDAIPNPFETIVVNYRFVKPLIIKQGKAVTTFNIGDIVKGDRLVNGNVNIHLNTQDIEINKSFVEETSEEITIITTETDQEIKKINGTRTPLEKIAIGFLIVLGVLIFIKLLKVI